MQDRVTFWEALDDARLAAAYDDCDVLKHVRYSWLTAALPMVMLPEMARRQATGKEGREVMWRRLLYGGVAGGAVVAAYFVAPVPIISLLFGRAYTQAAGLVGLLGLGMPAYEMAILMTYHNLATGRSGVPRSVAYCPGPSLAEPMMPSIDCYGSFLGPVNG